MRNLRLLATVLFVAVLLVGVVLLLRQTNVQNDTSVTSTQVTNQRLAANATAQTDPPKKKIKVANKPLYLSAEKQPLSGEGLTLKQSSSTTGTVTTSANQGATLSRLNVTDVTLKDVAKNKNGVNDLKKQGRSKTKSK